MVSIGVYWGAILVLVVPFIIWAIIIFKLKERIAKIECIMAGIACISGLLSYSIPETGVVSNPNGTAGICIAFGVIAGIALLVVGLIEIKRFEIKNKV
ncbi:hypothetical protein [Aureivirga marina]|uniref:hypothetical protein n=1 Tax=Aureivirga marina TaxID=1182451 RepID=UPI0018CA454E|nr:hypothetical protein [Aureivirga marina]